MQRVRDYVIQRLRDEVRSGKRGTSAALARALHISTAHIANLLSEPPSRQPGEELCRTVAEYWGMTYAELERAATGGEPPPAVARDLASTQLPAGTFLLKLRRLPGLEEWVEAHPAKLTVEDLARGMQLYEEVRPRSREDGVPFGGWDAFFDDARAGRLSGPAKAGDQAAAEALEYSQLPRATRKRIRDGRTP